MHFWNFLLIRLKCCKLSPILVKVLLKSFFKLIYAAVIWNWAFIISKLVSLQSIFQFECSQFYVKFYLLCVFYHFLSKKIFVWDGARFLISMGWEEYSRWGQCFIQQGTFCVKKYLVTRFSLLLENVYLTFATCKMLYCCINHI